MRDGNNLDTAVCHAIDDAVGKPVEDVSTGAGLEKRPDSGCFCNDCDCPLCLPQECICCVQTSLEIPLKRVL